MDGYRGGKNRHGDDGGSGRGDFRHSRNNSIHGDQGGRDGGDGGMRGWDRGERGGRSGDGGGDDRGWERDRGGWGRPRGDFRGPPPNRPPPYSVMGRNSNSFNNLNNADDSGKFENTGSPNRGDREDRNELARGRGEMENGPAPNQSSTNSSPSCSTSNSNSHYKANFPSFSIMPNIPQNFHSHSNHTNNAINSNNDPGNESHNAPLPNIPKFQYRTLASEQTSTTNSNLKNPPVILASSGAANRHSSGQSGGQNGIPQTNSQNNTKNRQNVQIASNRTGLTGVTGIRSNASGASGMANARSGGPAANMAQAREGGQHSNLFNTAHSAEKQYVSRSARALLGQKRKSVSSNVDNNAADDAGHSAGNASTQSVLVPSRTVVERRGNKFVRKSVMAPPPAGDAVKLQKHTSTRLLSKGRNPFEQRDFDANHDTHDDNKEDNDDDDVEHFEASEEPEQNAHRGDNNRRASTAQRDREQRESPNRRTSRNDVPRSRLSQPQRLQNEGQQQHPPPTLEESQQQKHQHQHRQRLPHNTLIQQYPTRHRLQQQEQRRQQQGEPECIVIDDSSDEEDPAQAANSNSRGESDVQTGGRKKNAEAQRKEAELEKEREQQRLRERVRELQKKKEQEKQCQEQKKRENEEVQQREQEARQQRELQQKQREQEEQRKQMEQEERQKQRQGEEEEQKQKEQLQKQREQDKQQRKREKAEQQQSKQQKKHIEQEKREQKLKQIEQEDQQERREKERQQENSQQKQVNQKEALNANQMQGGQSEQNQQHEEDEGKERLQRMRSKWRDMHRDKKKKNSSLQESLHLDDSSPHIEKASALSTATCTAIASNAVDPSNAANTSTDVVPESSASILSSKASKSPTTSNTGGNKRRRQQRDQWSQSEMQGQEQGEVHKGPRKEDAEMKTQKKQRLESRGQGRSSEKQVQTYQNQEPKQERRERMGARGDQRIEQQQLRELEEQGEQQLEDEQISRSHHDRCNPQEMEHGKQRNNGVQKEGPNKRNEEQNDLRDGVSKESIRLKSDASIIAEVEQDLFQLVEQSISCAYLLERHQKRQSQPKKNAETASRSNPDLSASNVASVARASFIQGVGEGASSAVARGSREIAEMAEGVDMTSALQQNDASKLNPPIMSTRNSVSSIDISSLKPSRIAGKSPESSDDLQEVGVNANQHQGESKRQASRPWETDEIERFMEGLKRFGPHWVRVQYIVATRDLNDVIVYGLKHLKKKEAKGNASSLEENEEIAQSTSNSEGGESSVVVSDSDQQNVDSNEEASDDDDVIPLFACNRCLEPFRDFKEACEHENNCTSTIDDFDRTKSNQEATGSQNNESSSSSTLHRVSKDPSVLPVMRNEVSVECVSHAATKNSETSTLRGVQANLKNNQQSTEEQMHLPTETRPVLNRSASQVSNEEKWEMAFKELEKFKKNRGNLKIPRRFQFTPDSINLYSWLQRQKTLNRKRKLASKLKERLVQLGVQFDAVPQSTLTDSIPEKAPAKKSKSKLKNEKIQGTSSSEGADKDEEELPLVMNTVDHLSSTTFDSRGRPVQKLTIMCGTKETLFDFEVRVKDSNILNAGLGAFLTYLGARVLKPEAQARSARLMTQHVIDDTIQTRKPLVAVLHSDPNRGTAWGSAMQVTLTGENLHHNQNYLYWSRKRSAKYTKSATENPNSAHKFNEDSAPCEVHEEVKKLRSQLGSKKGIGFLGIHSEDDYVPDDSLCFCSHSFGMIDLGRYGPFRPDDRKTELHYNFKNFIHNYEPAEWSYGVAEAIMGQKQVIDITDDATGTLHEMAKLQTPIYVNEVGHDKNLTSNIEILDKEDRSVHYYICIDKQNSMKKGDTQELLCNYDNVYEDVRERKGYGKVNIYEGVGGDSDDGARLSRNFVERQNVEEDIAELSFSQLFYLIEFLSESILDPIEKSISQSFQHENKVLRTGDLIARRRLHWLAQMFLIRLGDLVALEYPRPKEGEVDLEKFDLGKNDTLASAIRDNLGKWRWQKMASVFPRLNEKLQCVVMNELSEELLYQTKESIPSPLDPTVWSKLAIDLTKQVTEDIAKYIYLSSGAKNDLAETLLKRAKVAATLVREGSNAIDSEGNGAHFIEMFTFKSPPQKLQQSIVNSDDISKNFSLYDDNPTIRFGNAASLAEIQAYEESLDLCLSDSYAPQSLSTKLTECQLSIVSQYMGASMSFPNNEDRQYHWMARSVDSLRRGAACINEHWYLTQQVFAVIHGLSTTLVNWSNKDCILEKLCDAVGIELNHARKVLAKGVAIPRLPKPKVKSSYSYGLTENPDTVPNRRRRGRMLVYEGAAETEFPGWRVRKFRRPNSRQIDSYWYHPEVEGIQVRSRVGIREIVSKAKEESLSLKEAMEALKSAQAGRRYMC